MAKLARQRGRQREKSLSDFARELERKGESETSSDKPQKPENTGLEERGVPAGDTRVTDTNEAEDVVVSDDEDDFETELKRKETEKTNISDPCKCRRRTLPSATAPDGTFAEDYIGVAVRM